MARTDADNTAVELFAGVGGFRLGLEAAGWTVQWSNQWEPGTKAQHASWCYEYRFGSDGHVCADIESVLDWAVDKKPPPPGASWDEIPAHRLLVGGFPCQDYSVAKPLNQADGIAGKKGVLWWQINRWLTHFEPELVVLENVDRLLKSPSSQRGRDFAVMLACFARLGYRVSWRVVNAADYGYPQRRRRVFVLAERTPESSPHDASTAAKVMVHSGVLARAFPVDPDSVSPLTPEQVGRDPFTASQSFGLGAKRSRWGPVGLMVDGTAWTGRAEPDYDGPVRVLRDVLEPSGTVPARFDIPHDQLARWRYMKGAKREPRVAKNGHRYLYTEGRMEFPDRLERPARTVLTSEGGSSPSRSRHVIRAPDGRLRRLTPVELERLNGFEAGWTELMATPDGVRQMSDTKRAFMMGNALVVGLVERIARELPR